MKRAKFTKMSLWESSVSDGPTEQRSRISKVGLARWFGMNRLFVDDSVWKKGSARGLKSGSSWSEEIIKWWSYRYVIERILHFTILKHFFLIAAFLSWKCCIIKYSIIRIYQLHLKLASFNFVKWKSSGSSFLFYYIF